MFAGTVRVAGGDVVASGTSVYVVHRLGGEELTLLRVESNGGAQHRADVAPEHWSDLAVSGLPLQDVVVRCIPIRRYGTCNLAKLGHVSEALRHRIDTALKRETMTRRFEDSPSMQSTLLASTSSRGRRVGAVRHV